MESNDVVTAPQCTDINALYDIWRQNHHGAKDSFLVFMTSPSVERDAFITTFQSSLETNGSVLALNINADIE